ncbi:MAG: glycoside hydrolase family 5 protein [Caldilineaceae bacterium]
MTATPVIDPFEQNEQLGQGINLGNMLEAPREGEWGLTVRDEYFPAIAAAGFDSVRIPIRWSTHAQTESPYTIDESFFERVDHVVAQALDAGLLVVINIHHYEEIMVDPPAHRERLLGLWEQIAAHYQDAPPDVLFEVLNEPNNKLTAGHWNDLLAAALEVIRVTNPTRNVVVGPANWYNVGWLADLKLPEDEHIIVSVHYYEPFRFTHQGAEWVNGSDPWLGSTWTGEGGQAEAVTRDLQTAASWGEKHNRPINLGEFGAYSKADTASRVQWTRHVARTAEGLGMSWHYWEFGAGFGVYDPAGQEWRVELLDALLPK